MVATEAKGIPEDASLLWCRGPIEDAEPLAAHIPGTVTLVAPTERGRTLTVLAALKSKNMFPATWLTPLLAILSDATGERVGQDAVKLNISYYLFAGKKEMCPYAGRYREAVYHFCRLRKTQCSLFRPLLKAIPPPFSRWKELKEWALANGLCPYYLQFAVAKDAQLVIAHYSASWQVKRGVLVVDEAHRILIPREKRLSIEKCRKALEVIRTYDEELYAQLRKIETGKVDVELWAIERAIDYFLDHPLSGKVLNFLGFMHEAITSGAVLRINGGIIRAYLPPQLPKGSITTVYLTEILPDFQDFPTNSISTFIIRVPFKPRTAYVTKWLTSRFERETFGGYRELVEEVLRFGAKRVVFFAPKRLVPIVKPRVNYFEEVPPEDWEGVACFLQRSRFSEGVSLTADVIVVLGAPFLPPEVTSSLESFYGASRDAAIAVPMVIATLQSIRGAIWREKDGPLILLADRRFARYEKYFKPYLQLKEISREELEKLREFFSRGGSSASA